MIIESIIATSVASMIFYIGRRFERVKLQKIPAEIRVAELTRAHKELMKENNALNEQRIRLETTVREHEHTVRRRDDRVKTLEELCAEYKRIAKTHVISDGLSPDETRCHSGYWDKRLYSDSPEKNLAALELDLMKLEPHDVEFTLTITPTAGWAAAWNETHYYIQNEYAGYSLVEKRYAHKSKTLTFKGPPRRVFAEMTTHLKDRSFGLTIPGSKDCEVKWKTSSPMIFKVNLDLFQKHAQPSADNIKFVEVLRVEEVPKEIVVEKVVYPKVDESMSSGVNVEALVESSDVKAHIEIAVEEAVARRLGIGARGSRGTTL